MKRLVSIVPLVLFCLLFLLKADSPVFGYNRTVTNPTTSSLLSSSVMRGELQTLENEVSSLFTIYDTNYSVSVFSTTTVPWFKSGVTASSTSNFVTLNASTLSLVTPLSIANGGTNATSFGATNGLAAFDGTKLSNFSGYTLTSTLLSTLNASSTLFSIFNSAWFGATATTTITSTGNIGVGTTTPWASIGINANGLTAPALNIGSSTKSYFTINKAGGIELSATQPATSTSMTLDWSNTPPQVEYQIGVSGVTITFINATTSQYWGSTKRVWVCNPGTTAGTLTWVGVEWIGTTPNQTLTANQCDLWSFNVLRATSTSAYKVSGGANTAFQ